MRQSLTCALICAIFVLTLSSCGTTVDIHTMHEMADRRNADTGFWQEALANGDEREQAKAALLLGRIGGEESAKLIAPLLKSEYVAVRKNAAFGLGITNDVSQVSVLREQLAVETNAEVESAIWLALANLNVTRLQPEIVDAWDHEPEQHAALSQATAFLWAFHRKSLPEIDVGLVRRMFEASVSEQEAVAVNAAAALARIRSDTSVLRARHAIAALNDAKFERARVLLIKTLTGLTDPAVEKRLQQIFEGKFSTELAASVNERAEAASALVTRYSGDALKALIMKISSEPEWRVRAAAFQALNPDKVAALRELLQTHVTQVTEDAAVLNPLLNPIEFRDETRDPMSETVAHTEALRATNVNVLMQTNRGKIVIQLLPDAPYTAWSFLNLVNKGYYNGLVFHRVVPNFVAQGGDPTGRGDGGPGYSIREELSELPHDVGYVGMATAGKDTGGSQFFFNTARNPHLDWHYTVFAKVVEGEDVMFALQQGDTIVRAQMVD